ncbi:MAG: NAD(P)-dependent oxidoreductase, partial [Hyphomicrobiaceae bacterium]
LTSLKWAQSLATGVDHFVKCPYFSSGTLLTSARGIHGPSMRETAAFLMLSLSRDALRLGANKAAKRWDRWTPWTTLNGKTATVVGIGVGGIAIGNLLKAFGMHVIGLTRSPRQLEAFDEVAHTDRLMEIAKRTDWLIDILPGDAANDRLIGRDVFNAMRPGSYFINVGRGSTIDESALIDALKSGKLAGAGLDVFAVSPLPEDNPLWSMPNVFICPQTGGFTSDYEDMVWPIVEGNMALFLAGREREMRNLIPH